MCSDISAGYGTYVESFMLRLKDPIRLSVWLSERETERNVLVFLLFNHPKTATISAQSCRQYQDVAKGW